jgi:hypothetical protein
MAVDSQWANVKLLLPVDGPNNSTSITDVKAHTVTVNGNAKLSTAQYPSGCTSSLVLDGNNDYLTLSHADFAFGTGDFAIEMWVYKAGDTVTGTANSAYLLDFRTAEPSAQIDLYVYGSTGSAPDKVALYVNGSDRIVSTTAMGASWKNVTMSRISGVTRLFIDGTQEGGDYTDSNNYTGTAINVSARYANLSGDYRSFNGYFGPIRITKGNGRGYSSNFTPPSLPFDRPKLSGVTRNVSSGAFESKVVVALKRSTLAIDGTAVSNAGDGTYTIYPTDFSEHVVMRFDTATYPLVDGSGSENAIIFDRVIPG